jgi:hypothetical protein
LLCMTLFAGACAGICNVVSMLDLPTSELCMRCVHESRAASSVRYASKRESVDSCRRPRCRLLWAFDQSGHQSDSRRRILHTVCAAATCLTMNTSLCVPRCDQSIYSVFTGRSRSTFRWQSRSWVPGRTRSCTCVTAWTPNGHREHFLIERWG